MATLMYVLSGPGGVGKTTTAAALALSLAKIKKTVLLTIDPSQRLKSILQITNLDDCRKPENFVALSFDKKRTFDRLMKKSSSDLLLRLQKSKLYAFMVESLPQLHEYMAVEEIYQIQERFPEWVIVLDTPPGKHFDDFLIASDKLLAFFSDRNAFFLKIMGGKLSSLLGLGIRKLSTLFSFLISPQFLEALIDFLLALQEVRKSLVHNQQVVREFLDDKEKTKFFFVTTAENILQGNFELNSKFPIDSLIVNRDWSHLESKEFSSTIETLKNKLSEIKTPFLRIPDLDYEPDDQGSIERMGIFLEEKC